MFQRFELRIVVTLQTFPVGFLDLRHVGDDLHGQSAELRIERAEELLLYPRFLLVDRLLLHLPGVAIVLLPLGVGIDLSAKLSLFRTLLFQELRIQKTVLATLESFEGIFQTENHGRSLTRLLGAASGVVL